MDYITEMMETAGVESQYFYDVILQDTIKPEEKFPLRSCTKGEVISYCRDKKYYGYCKVNKVIKIYPAFTAEKQLEIIKLIIEKNGFCGFTNFRDKDKWSISCGFTFPIGPKPEKGINFNPTFRKCETFDQALAQLTTELMKAQELDKKKVKGVLEG